MSSLEGLRSKAWGTCGGGGVMLCIENPRLSAGKHVFSLLSHLSHPRALCKSFSVEVQVFSTVK